MRRLSSSRLAVAIKKPRLSGDLLHWPALAEPANTVKPLAVFPIDCLADSCRFQLQGAVARFTLIITWNTQKVTAFVFFIFSEKKVTLWTETTVLYSKNCDFRVLMHAKGEEDHEPQPDSSLIQEICFRT
jgi:hypothetical protein